MAVLPLVGEGFKDLGSGERRIDGDNAPSVLECVAETASTVTTEFGAELHLVFAPDVDHAVDRIADVSVPTLTFSPATGIGPRPDFSLLIHPAYINRDGFETDAELEISEKTPPAFMIQAEDDKTLVDSSLAYFMVEYARA